MGIFSKKNNKANFYKEYKITEKLMKESTITHITEDKIHIETGSYNNGLISVLDIDVTVNIMKAWEWRFQKYSFLSLLLHLGICLYIVQEVKNAIFFKHNITTWRKLQIILMNY